MDKTLTPGMDVALVLAQIDPRIEYKYDGSLTDAEIDLGKMQWRNLEIAPTVEVMNAAWAALQAEQAIEATKEAEQEKARDDIKLIDIKAVETADLAQLREIVIQLLKTMQG